ncbi:transcriptional regulator, MarR family [Pseudogulbenkiania sp. NH8B]|uniref:Transcriptional regulator, MarR family n=1 Tax=Pseudogulbenkiania ferrooxidans 2002 TaxID=279714 RepID=B9YYL3_9NEIS|nr:MULTISPECIES: MarR family transcriptional regulator [Pseudogulbenkiania]EEG10216.1 transcriptional regulator, MarR family [Pseudogulbenkiania ferrooxidans 2002]BAK78480.1 transcriptional regulator, MarR family [Pseudogulbenkiania sp. NH8B]
MNKSFHQLEQAIDRVDSRFPGVPRQEVILTRLYYHIMPRLGAYLNEALKDYGIHESVWMTLMTMYACPDHVLYPSDISDTLDSSRTNATRISDELVKNGWAERQPCAEDRRKIRLVLTDAGIRFVELIMPVARDRNRSLWSDFSGDEKVQLEGLLRKLLARLGG